ncbi:Tetratricopeptide repeat protein [Candidatus Koribacter versatilis Ellin345]|uniref:Tetratricopeptide repeat protein n=1 Tax=Koribacter versatilis (strain Ellin345) TaxID=204669 RepID=Q1IN85_KORVE|nr:Tetratricopeptide repeat protein [Candidatus Koribacter versatilis Ellin345]
MKVGQIFPRSQAALLFLVVLLVASSVAQSPCAKCHADIVRSYSTTAMANASGPASLNPLTGAFHHEPSDVNYKIELRDGHLFLTYARTNDVHGQRELLYYIGQGRRGRTYLFADDGFLFESPVNWYADEKKWDVAPGYTASREIPMNLPALPSCLECHTSNFRPPIAGTENRYTLPVFTATGITCERCHGPSDAHANGKGAILNPAKLPADRRDQICMQCHLEGDAAIERPGKHLYDFRPGDDLSQFVRYYVMADEHGSSLRAASQFEALAQSTCKKKSGDKLWCGTCHDPHRTIAPEERVSFYRSKCLSCHSAEFSAKHHTENPDCTACHMPASQSKDVAHTEVTDHRILRRPAAPPAPPTSLPKLVPFPYSAEADNDARDKGLAWQAIVNSGMTDAQPEAERWLRKASEYDKNDPAVLSALAFLSQKRGDTETARALYTSALSLNPSELDAENNLAILEARAGHTRRAVELWEDAFRRAPGHSGIGMNLALAFCSTGQYDAARQFTTRVLEFNPDLPAARHLLSGLNASPPKCAP